MTIGNYGILYAPCLRQGWGVCWAQAFTPMEPGKETRDACLRVDDGGNDPSGQALRFIAAGPGVRLAPRLAANQGLRTSGCAGGDFPNSPFYCAAGVAQMSMEMVTGNLTQLSVANSPVPML